MTSNAKLVANYFISGAGDWGVTLPWLGDNHWFQEESRDSQQKIGQGTSRSDCSNGVRSRSVEEALRRGAHGICELSTESSRSESNFQCKDSTIGGRQRRIKSQNGYVAAIRTTRETYRTFGFDFIFTIQEMKEINHASFQWVIIIIGLVAILLGSCGIYATYGNRIRIENGLQSFQNRTVQRWNYLQTHNPQLKVPKVDEPISKPKLELTELERK